MAFLYWFRHDLRIHDQPALTQALSVARAAGQALHAVWVLDADWLKPTPWGFVRASQRRLDWWNSAAQALAAQLAGIGVTLQRLSGDPVQVLLQHGQALGVRALYCEDIAAPFERAQVAALQAAGLTVHAHWQSSLLDPNALPFQVSDLPQVFTRFRQQIEQGGVQALPPLLAPESQCPVVDAEPAGERAAQAHVRRYFNSPAPWRYKETRNQLAGEDFSSGWSPWLATGALSARWVHEQLRLAEAQQGANDSTYWLWFELLWRDYFRLLHLQHGQRLYRHQGLSHLPKPSHDAQAFARWTRGETAHPFVNAGMRELAATGRLSNRMRQVVASYLVHDLDCDWRAGAAWFEAQLLDHDPYSNQGNWLYIAGRGTDPRQGRRFNPDGQAAQHDPEGLYQRRWNGGAVHGH
jgi:deoxyribodipyrimidine photo-lyase